VNKRPTTERVRRWRVRCRVQRFTIQTAEEWRRSVDETGATHARMLCGFYSISSASVDVIPEQRVTMRVWVAQQIRIWVARMGGKPIRA
jgi:hypothetical protein